MSRKICSILFTSHVNTSEQALLPHNPVAFLPIYETFMHRASPFSERISAMSVTRTPEEREQGNELERDRISTQSEHNGPTNKPATVLCFACRKRITAG